MAPVRRRACGRPVSRLCALLVVMATVIAAACGNSSEEPASGEVVLYTSMPNEVVDRLKGVVERRFPDLDGEFWLGPIDSEGIVLEVVRGRTADIQRLIDDEVAAGEDVEGGRGPAGVETDAGGKRGGVGVRAGGADGAADHGGRTLSTSRAAKAQRGDGGTDFGEDGPGREVAAV